MPNRSLGTIVTIGGLAVFLFGLLQLLPCLHMASVTDLGHCWSDFLLATVGLLLYLQ